MKKIRNVVIICIGAGMIFTILYCFLGDYDSYKLVTEYGDEFIIEFGMISFPEKTSRVSIRINDFDGVVGGPLNGRFDIDDVSISFVEGNEDYRRYYIYFKNSLAQDKNIVLLDLTHNTIHAESFFDGEYHVISKGTHGDDSLVLDKIN